jgi:hypothetical protein
MALQDALGQERVSKTFRDALAVTPSDTIGPAQRIRDVRAIWADVGGTVSLITDAVATNKELNDGGTLTSASAVSFTLLSGVILELGVAYVLATGTAATGIKVLF